MKSFEEHLARAAYENGCKNGARRKRIEDRRMTREQRKAQTKRTLAFIAAACMILMALLAFLAAFTVPASADTGKREKALTEAYNAKQVEVLEAQEDYENEKIEKALLEQANRIDDVTVTHYCICDICCGKSDGITASGVMATPGVTVAVDPDIIPLGSDVLVDYGDGEIHYMRADDVGGAIKGNHIDLCVSSHQEAIEQGIKTATVWWVYHGTN